MPLPNLSEMDTVYEYSPWGLIRTDKSSNEVEASMQDFIIGSIFSRGFSLSGSSYGIQKITLIPCSERMRGWLGMNVVEMGTSPYDVQDGLRNNFFKCNFSSTHIDVVFFLR